MRDHRLPISSPSARRFTLIELLVVVAIIAILAALLLPTLATSRRRAQRLMCLHQVRTWGQALTLYADENVGQLPERKSTYTPASTGERRYFTNLPGVVFFGQIEDYMGDTTSDIMKICPLTGRYQHTADTMDYAYYGRMTAIYRYDKHNLSLGPRSPVRIADGEDQYGRMSVLFADVNRHDDYGNKRPFATSHYNPSSPVIDYGTRTAAIPLGVNTGYIDGHAAWIPWGKLDRTVRYRYWDTSYHWAADN